MRLNPRVLKPMFILLLSLTLSYPPLSYSSVPCLSENINTESSCIETGISFKATNLLFKDSITVGSRFFQIELRHTRVYRGFPLEEIPRVKAGFSIKRRFRLAVFGTLIELFRKYYELGGAIGFGIWRVFFDFGFERQSSRCRVCNDPDDVDVTLADYKGYFAGRIYLLDGEDRSLELLGEVMVGNYKTQVYVTNGEPHYEEREGVGYYYALSIRFIGAVSRYVYPIFSIGFASGNDPLDLNDDMWTVSVYKDYPPLFFVQVGILVWPW